MTIIVEDGSIVTGANSWVTRAALITYASARGVVIADTAATDVMLVKAADFISAMEPRLKGDLVDRNQPTAYPRLNLYISDWWWLSTEIPTAVIKAQFEVALEINAGEDPYNPSAAALPVVSERVEGAVTVDYANPGSGLKVTKVLGSSAYISILLKTSGLTVIRV